VEKTTARKVDPTLKNAISASHRQPPPFFNNCGGAEEAERNTIKIG